MYTHKLDVDCERGVIKDVRRVPRLILRPTGSRPGGAYRIFESKPKPSSPKFAISRPLVPPPRIIMPTVGDANPKSQPPSSNQRTNANKETESDEGPRSSRGHSHEEEESEGRSESEESSEDEDEDGNHRVPLTPTAAYFSQFVKLHFENETKYRRKPPKYYHLLENNSGNLDRYGRNARQNDTDYFTISIQ